GRAGGGTAAGATARGGLPGAVRQRTAGAIPGAARPDRSPPCPTGTAPCTTRRWALRSFGPGCPLHVLPAGTSLSGPAVHRPVRPRSGAPGGRRGVPFHAGRPWAGDLVAGLAGAPRWAA